MAAAASFVPGDDSCRLATGRVERQIAFVSKTDILAELPKLTREERREVVMIVHQIDGDDWLDEGELSFEEKAKLESRLAGHEEDPKTSVPWPEFEARLNRRLGE